MRNRRRSLAGRDYVLTDLGRPAVFLLPARKLRKRLRKTTIKKGLHEFLTKNFGAYTTSLIPSFGLWKNTEKALISDKCCEYEVSFLGKKRIPLLLKKLAEIASVINEECIYVKTGQYSCLVYPKKPSF